jgi:hypothetical protein
MDSVDVMDVTKAIETFIENGVLTIPKNCSLDNLFPNNFKGAKFLQIQLSNSRKINILNDNYRFDVSVNLLSIDKEISIVYYIFITPTSNWKAIIAGQLSDIKGFGLLDEADLYIHITDEHHTDGVLDFVRKAAGHKATIHHSFINQFEYPAIKLLHNLAKEQPGKTYMYFHTKGMSYAKKRRNDSERKLMAGTFKYWRRNMEAFQDPSVNKLGMFPAIDNPDWGGWIWYNFFIVKGSYLSQCRDVSLTENRHYYESWLAGYKDTIAVNDCYSLFTNKKENFSQQYTVASIDQLPAVYTNYFGKRKFSLSLRYPFIKLKK